MCEGTAAKRQRPVNDCQRLYFPLFFLLNCPVVSSYPFLFLSLRDRTINRKIKGTVVDF